MKRRRAIETKLKTIPDSDQLLIDTLSLKKEHYPDPKKFHQLSLNFNEQIFKTQKQKNHIKAEDIIPNILESLGKMGYTVMSNTIDLAIKPDEELYLDTSREQYKLKLQIRETGEILYRLVRVVASEKEIQPTRYQEQADIEANNKWCNDYNTLTKDLKEIGIQQTATMRLEPEEEPVKVEVKPELVRREKEKPNQKTMGHIKSD